MNTPPTLGFIGLGAMGAPMTLNLLKEGYAVWAFDLDEERLRTCVEAGATAGESAADVVQHSEWVLTSLPSSDAWVRVADEELLPQARRGQVFIDFGTVVPLETRRLAAAFSEKGAALLDVPVSGGPFGAQKAKLLMFAGGDEATVEKARPLLEVVGGSEHLTYCGPAGSGQVVKGVNQLLMGLFAASALEALSFGVRAGVDAAVVRQAISDTESWRQYFSGIARRVVQGEGEQVGVKFRELPYFIREAQAQGVDLPLTKILYEFCDAGERVVVDDNRQAPSFWHELME